MPRRVFPILLATIAAAVYVVWRTAPDPAEDGTNEVTYRVAPEKSTSAAASTPAPQIDPPQTTTDAPPAAAATPTATAPTAPTVSFDPSVPTDRAIPAIRRADGTLVLPLAAPMVENLHAESQPPENDLEILQDVLAAYRRVFGENPTGGLNAEIVGGLIGQNSRRLAVIPPDSGAISASGELLDRWGTPYFFHPVSREFMQVISAGPDGVLWTGDDIGPPGGLESGPE